MKRAFDLIVSALLLVVLSPLLAAIAILIRFTVGKPVLFLQVRPGRGGKPFTMVKFRTMAALYDAWGEPLPDGDRITPLGAFLRRTSLDELPELWNVLKGEMSLVGPRPLLMEYLPLYTPEQARRNLVRPGITGWAQVCGRNAISWAERFALDVWYVDHQTFWLDVKILGITALKVVQCRDVSQEGHATMEKFTGT